MEFRRPHILGKAHAHPFPPARDFSEKAAADTSDMSTTSVEYDYAPVPRLLLAHCASFDDARPSAYARLEAELGDNFARMLVSALASPQGVRGSSSP
jgi:hypothetical protein